MKTIFFQRWEHSPNIKIFCTDKENENDLVDTLRSLDYDIDVHDFDKTGKTVYLEKRTYSCSDTIFWYTVLTLLQEHGYELDSEVQFRYKWYKQRIESQESQNKQNESEEIEEPINTNCDCEYGLWCNKYGCATNIIYCIKKCKRNTVYGMNCRPERVKIKKEGI